MNTPIRAYFGHHKCATQWIAAILRDLALHLDLRHRVVHNAAMFDLDLAGYIEAEGIDVLSYINAEWAYVEPLQHLAGFHMVRDPRDIIVSAYFSHRYSHPTEGWPQLVEHRRRLEQASKEEGLILEMEFNRNVFDAMGNWNYNRPEILELKMEDVTSAPQRAFEAIIAHLGLGGGEEQGDGALQAQLARILEEHAFRRKAGGRVKGDEDIRSHYRRGQAGDWRNHFSDRHVEAFRSRYNDLLLELGYETDPDWT